MSDSVCFKLRTLPPEINCLRMNNISNDHLKYLTNIKINTLIINSDLINDQGFIYLNGDNIREIRLNAPNITDCSFKYLYNFDKISIEDAQNITDRGLNNLVNVQFLTLINCSKITDNGFKYLTRLKKFEIRKCNNVKINGIKCLNMKHINLTHIKSICKHDFKYFSNTHSIILPFIMRLCIIGMRYLSNVNCVFFDTGIRFEKNVRAFNPFRYMSNISKVKFISCVPTIMGAKFLLTSNVKTIYVPNELIDRNGCKFLIDNGCKKIAINDYFTKINIVN